MRYSTLTPVDGIFHVPGPSFFHTRSILTAMCCWQWNGCWPIHLTPDSPREEVKCPALDSDRHHLRHLEGRTYMASVSPWFFTVRIFFDPTSISQPPLRHQHYGPDSWNKNVGSSSSPPLCPVRLYWSLVDLPRGRLAAHPTLGTPTCSSERR